MKMLTHTSRKIMKRIMSSLITKVIISLLLGIGLLFFISRFVDMVAAVDVVLKNLGTPRGLVLFFFSGIPFLLAFSIRGLRWKLFLNSVCTVRTGTAIRIYLVSVFLNFLLPVSSGEIAKTLMLKRVAGIPISRSLPTVAMDRSLDLLPALVVMMVVPLLGITMEIKLWVVLSIVGGLLIMLALFVGLTVWKHRTAILLLRKVTHIFPRAIGEKIEGFATGFVDSLLASTSRPRIFLFALALTSLALACDSLYAMLAFWAIGLPISFGTAMFGYLLYNLFYILPTSPAGVGSNEAVGLLIFTGLLHLPADHVTAMSFSCHVWTAFLLCSAGLICLKSLGLKFSMTMGTKKQLEETQKPLVPVNEGVPISQ